LAGPKPEEAMIFTRGNPASSSASRRRWMAAALTPVPTRWRSSPSVR